MPINWKKLLKRDEVSKEEVEEAIEAVKKEEKKEPEIKPTETKPITYRIDNDRAFLDSCVIPTNDELAIVTDVSAFDNSPIKFPALAREGRFVPLNINYLTANVMKSVNNDFRTLKMGSKFVRSRVLQNAHIKPDFEADSFLECRAESSNSDKSFTLLCGYDLLAPRKVDSVEETNRYDEKSKKIFKIRTLDLRGKYDSLIIGTGIAISAYAGFSSRIELNH